MRYLFVLLILAGCASSEERRRRVEAQTDAAFEQCAGVFQPGTEAHFNCVQKMVMGAQPPRPAPQQTTVCRPDSYGAMRCTTR